MARLTKLFGREEALAESAPLGAASKSVSHREQRSQFRCRSSGAVPVFGSRAIKIWLLRSRFFNRLLRRVRESRWSGLNRRPAHYECAALPLSYTGGLRNEIYRLPRPLRQADAVGGGRAKISARRGLTTCQRHPAPDLGRAVRVATFTAV
jgi:hypothetical protein